MSKLDAVRGMAIMLGDNDILHDVNQAAGKITGVGRLEGRIRQALARAVG